MQTAVFLSNRSPHAARNNGTPYKALYCKDAYLGHFRVIRARTTRPTPRSWSTALGKDALSGTA